MCMREMRFLMKRNQLTGNLAFEDTSTIGFNRAQNGLPEESSLIIHALTSEGEVITGMEVFRRAYTLVGLGWLLSFTAIPMVKQIFDLLYLIFAKNRIRIGRLLGRRCDRACDR